MKNNNLFNISITFILLSFYGCLNYTQETYLYPDGSGKMKINYWMNLPQNSDTTTINRVGIFNPELITKEFSSAYSFLNNVEVYTDSVDSTTHALIDLNFNHIDSLNKVKVFEDFQFSLKDGASGQKIFSQYIPPIATGFGIDGSEYSVSYTYIFSGTIITHNAQTEDGQTLTWKYTLAEIGSGKTISVTFRPFKLKETPYWIYILSGIVLLIVIIFLFRKKKD
ncbi:MAG: hypothetical protein EHM47_05700 [Ignavibacteriales bacterium]|nr:MAG: hypothetical protein EHM47_05700 [Ignavibacteriales bacterium]